MVRNQCEFTSVKSKTSWLKESLTVIFEIIVKFQFFIDYLTHVFSVSENIFCFLKYFSCFHSRFSLSAGIFTR